MHRLIHISARRGRFGKPAHKLDSFAADFGSEIDSVFARTRGLRNTSCFAFSEFFYAKKLGVFPLNGGSFDGDSSADAGAEFC